MISTTVPPSRRAAHIGFVAAPFLGLALAVTLVWQSSYSAFSAQTQNPGNSWDTGAVTLTDNDAADAALFDVGPMVPGDSGERCITVTSGSTAPTTVKMYGSGLNTTKEVSTYLNLRITLGTGGGTNGDCTGFTPGGTNGNVFSGTLAGFTATTWAGGYPVSGSGLWLPTPWDGVSTKDSRTYRIAWDLDNAADNDQQSGAAGVTFVWEAQDN